MDVNIKADLHRLIDEIEDKALLEAVYTILEKNISDQELSTEQTKELDKRIKAYEQGETQFYTWEEAKERIRKRAKNAL
jgi:putative addiction module component (TIGR02574 family)